MSLILQHEKSGLCAVTPLLTGGKTSYTGLWVNSIEYKPTSGILDLGTCNVVLYLQGRFSALQF